MFVYKTDTPYVSGSLQSKEWRKVSKRIRIRDNWRCVCCGDDLTFDTRRLKVHHIDGDACNNHPCNLVSLCPTCHATLHDRSTDGHMFFAGKNRYGIAWRMAKILDLDRRMVRNGR